jgi:hypothetical protein
MPFLDGMPVWCTTQGDVRCSIVLCSLVTGICLYCLEVLQPIALSPLPLRCTIPFVLLTVLTRAAGTSVTSACTA